MYEYNDQVEMYEREMRRNRRMQRIRHERRRKRITMLATVTAIVLIASLFIILSRPIETHANTGYKYYKSITVECGDSVWEIAESYIDYDYYDSISEYMKEVKSINHVDENYSIIAGEILIVPYYSPEFVY
jgi:hypothetical protein